MKDALYKNLDKGIELLQHITDEQYSNKSVEPYFASIGGHIRHILDVFDCVLEGIDLGEINLIKRKRNVLVEEFTSHGISYFNNIKYRLSKLSEEDFNKLVFVTDDLGLGEVTTKSTVSGLLIQAHSHAIHHFASIGYIASQLRINIPNTDFGFNPTTPKINSNF